MALADAPGNKCGFYLSLSDVGENHLVDSEEDCHEWNRAICCWRDADPETGRCILHEDGDGKPFDLVEDAIDETESRLDGAVLRGIDFPDDYSLRDYDLRGADLSQCDLSHIRFCETFLSSVDFTDSNIRDSVFVDCTISESDFTRADLRDTQFKEEAHAAMTISGSSFREADMRGVEFKFSHAISNSDFTEANLENTDLSERGFSYCTLHRTKFREASLEGARLSHNDVQNADFSESSCSGIDLWKADLIGADFENADVSHGNFGYNDFTQSDLTNADFSEARLEWVDMSEMDLQNVTLSEVDLSGSNLSKANLERSQLSESTLHRANLSGAILYQANLEGARLEYANLTGADLRTADITGAYLYQALLSNGRIDDHTLIDDVCIYETDEVEPVDSSADKFDAAAWVYRSLEALYEDNAMVEQAREYHVLKEESLRKSYWADWNNLDELEGLADVTKKWNLPKAVIYEANRLISRHSDSPYRVIAVSLIVILGSSLLYPFAGIELASSNVISWSDAISTSSGPIVAAGQLLGVFADSIYFSTVTFTTLGYGDVRPIGMGRWLATIESFIGPLLMALLVFVLGRRTTW